MATLIVNSGSDRIGIADLFSGMSIGTADAVVVCASGCDCEDCAPDEWDDALMADYAERVE